MRTSIRSLLAAVSLLAVLAPLPARAQYFGRNKVQWENFDFKVLKTDHFDIYYYDDTAPIIQDVGRMAERWYDRLSTVFEHEFERKPIVLYANHPDFQQTNTTMGFVGEGTGGFTDAFMNRIVLPLTGTYEENDHVLGHEMVHVFQFDIANQLSTSRRRFQIRTLPLWMIEGLAEYLSQGRIDPQTAMWMRDAAMRDELPTIEKLQRDPRLSPYQYGQAFWAYVGGRWSDRAVIETFLASGFIGIEPGIQRVLGIPSSELFADWHEASRRLYEPVIANRWGPDRLGDPIVKEEGRDIDVSPSLSPDGRTLAFLSSRELFSIDLFLADAATGKVLGRLVSSAGDPHMDALRFIDSAGTWSPDGRQLAFIAVEKGDNRIGIVDVETRSVRERFAIPEVPAITQIAWSPDGRKLAISGLRGGVTDLFLWDLASKQLSQITSDRYSELQPAWSPDGRFIAVASDRGTGTSFETLEYARPRISIIEVATGAVRTFDIFPGAKHINPQYSPDGRKLYFVADPDGVAQVFEYEIATGQTRQLTDVATGVAGITDLAPALTVASRTGEAVFTHFRDGRWTMYRANMELASQAAQPAQLVTDATMRAATLPPPVAQQPSRAPSTVSDYLSAPQEGLPAASTTFAQSGYSPALKLSYIGPPTIGIGYSETYGGAAGGSFAALWTRHSRGPSGRAHPAGRLFGRRPRNALRRGDVLPQPPEPSPVGRLGEPHPLHHRGGNVLHAGGGRSRQRTDGPRGRLQPRAGARHERRGDVPHALPAGQNAPPRVQRGRHASRVLRGDRVDLFRQRRIPRHRPQHRRHLPEHQLLPRADGVRRATTPSSASSRRSPERATGSRRRPTPATCSSRPVWPTGGATCSRVRSRSPSAASSTAATARTRRTSGCRPSTSATPRSCAATSPTRSTATNAP